MMPHDLGRLLDIAMVAEMLSVSPRTVRRMADAGKMPKPLRLGGKLIRWRPDEIAEWISDGCPNMIQDGAHS